jgi:DNA polymerase-3 subunit beta
MRALIPQPIFAALIDRGGAVAQKKGVIPALECVRITADADAQTISLASCDIDRFAEANITAKVEASGRFLVGFDALKTLIGKHQKATEVSLELTDEGVLTVKGGRSRVKLGTISADSFPAWADQPATSNFNLNGQDFERAFSRVRFATSTADNQWYLQGVCIDVTLGDAMHFVATDGHRLALSGMPIPEGAENCPRVIVPVETVDAALQVFKGATSVAVAVNEKSISLSADNLRLAAKLIEGTFPEYMRVVPARDDLPTAHFKRADFVDCLDRANTIAGADRYAAITFAPDDGAILLTANNQKGGEAIERLDAEVSEVFRPFKFNPRYAADFIRTLNVPELTIEQPPEPDDGKMVPHIIISHDAPDFIGLLMPTL